MQRGYADDRLESGKAGINPKEGAVKTEYKFIHFSKLSDDPEVWTCDNNRSQMSLGYIERYKPWRQMCFHPYAGTVFSDECLKDIAHFIGQLRK